MTTNDLKKYADEKFISFKPGRWMLHDWDHHGASFGFELYLIGSDWQLRSFTESQYGPSKIILHTQDSKTVSAIIECFSPTIK